MALPFLPLVATRLILLALRHIFDTEPKRALADILPLARQVLDQESALAMLEVLLRYYVQTTEVLDEEDIHELLINLSSQEDWMQTFIDRYIEQGKQQGLLLGREEGRQVRTAERASRHIDTANDAQVRRVDRRAAAAHRKGG